MSRFAAFSALLAALAAGTLSAQNLPVKPRDLYLQKVPEDSAAAPAQHHLGVRYTELLVDPPTRSVREVDPDTPFHEGDCLALEFTPNRNGALFVFNQGSSGSWQLLIPDPRMPDASGAAKAGVTLRVPSAYCFRLDGKPGIETLVLAITEREEDIDKMRRLMAESRDLSRPPAAGATTAGSSPNVDALRNEVQSWQRLGSRDLKVEKIASPESPGERPDSVYAVMSSASAADRLVIEVKIRHE
jgi:hypothetical protein